MKENVTDMIRTCDNLQTATGGNLQEEKSKFFACKWGWRSGLKSIKDILIEINVEIEKLQRK